MKAELREAKEAAEEAAAGGSGKEELEAENASLSKKLTQYKKDFENLSEKYSKEVMEKSTMMEQMNGMAMENGRLK